MDKYEKIAEIFLDQGVDCVAINEKKDGINIQIYRPAD